MQQALEKFKQFSNNYYDKNNELYLNRLTRDKIPYATHKNIQRMALRHLSYNPAAYDKFLSFLAYVI